MKSQISLPTERIPPHQTVLGFNIKFISVKTPKTEQADKKKGKKEKR